MRSIIVFAVLFAASVIEIFKPAIVIIASFSGLQFFLLLVRGHTCEPTGLGQQEGAPGHEEKQGRLQQREVPQLRKLGHVIKNDRQGAKAKVGTLHTM